MSFVFNLANNVEPLTVRLPDGKGGTTVAHIQRFDRKDRREWRAQLDAGRVDEACAHLSKEERAKMLLAYPILPLTHEGLNQYIYTDDGAFHVVSTCFKKSGVDNTLIEAIKEGSGYSDADLQRLALCLAGIVSVEQVAEAVNRAMQQGGKKEDKKEGKKDGEDPNHPLPNSGGD